MFNFADSLAKRTLFSSIATRLVCTPCWCLLSMLAFILYKNMHLSPFQIAVIVALKPMTSLFSPYWSQAIYQRPDRIIRNLVGANFLRHLPFLVMPWVQSSWFIIFSFGLYMMLTRATIPAWMELFKSNLPKTKREVVVSYGTVIDFLGTAVCAFLGGLLLDNYPDTWRWVFAAAAAMGILSTFFLSLIPAPTAPVEIAAPPSKESLIQPWKQVWDLVKTRKDFAVFQIGFMLGGSGLMIMQPALPQFFIDILDLSFTKMGIAVAFCKGIGVALTSPLWTRLFRRVNIFQLGALVTIFATIFPFLLLGGSYHYLMVYLAYALYGVMQAGSELSWHMSGLVFAQENDSSTFSSTNVLTVGIRGCIIPAVGSLLLPFFQPLGVILLGALLSFSASGYFLAKSRTQIAPQTIPE